ncbi:extracellular solute-binding protein [Corynebacterium sp.]|uniref:vWA domain-containing protein n=1 Tax=Corynebacterium sp. TaxID=1720 RepID=UPI003736C50B
MKRVWLALIAILASIGLVACAGETPGSGIFSGGKNFDDEPLTIVAATELQDLEPLVNQASEELGFPIVLRFPAGTLENSQLLKRGGYDGTVDATWFATNRYVDLIGAQGKLADETKIATSPVAFGIWSESAKRLGWDTEQPTWAEFAEAAANNEFTFGMTDPTASNSGFSALVSVSTALADTGQALSREDIHQIREPMKKLYQAQDLVSGSSGWLAHTFVEKPGNVDAIINYESTLYQLRDEGHPITVVVPRDGVISADYPLSTLAQPATEQAGEKVAALTEWMLDHQEEIAQTYRRPVEQVDNVPEELSRQGVIELAFPGDQLVVDTLLDAYNNEYRNPGSTTYVLDTSGSMEGLRIESLKAIMDGLISGESFTVTGDVSLRDNEKVTIWPFDPTVEPMTQVIDRGDQQAIDDLSNYAAGLRADGMTPLYSTLLAALRAADTESGIPSIVLLSDGVVTEGPDYFMFEQEYATLPEAMREIPVFVILYGEASEEEMTWLADLTGGKVFNAIDGDLSQVFKEIRAYQ